MTKDSSDIQPALFTQAKAQSTLRGLYNNRSLKSLLILTSDMDAYVQEIWQRVLQDGAQFGDAPLADALHVSAYIHETFAAQWDAPTPPAKPVKEAAKRLHINYERALKVYKREHALYERQRPAALRWFSAELIKAWPGRKAATENEAIAATMPDEILPEDYGDYATAIHWAISRRTEPLSAQDLPKTSLKEVLKAYKHIFTADVSDGHLNTCDRLFLGQRIADDTYQNDRHPDSVNVKVHAEILDKGVCEDGAGWTLRRINSKQAAKAYGNPSGKPNGSPLCFTYENDVKNQYDVYREDLMMVARDDGTRAFFINLPHNMMTNMADEQVSFAEICSTFPGVRAPIGLILKSQVLRHASLPDAPHLRKFTHTFESELTQVSPLLAAKLLRLFAEDENKKRLDTIIELYTDLEDNPLLQLQMQPVVWEAFLTTHKHGIWKQFHSFEALIARKSGYQDAALPIVKAALQQMARRKDLAPFKLIAHYAEHEWSDACMRQAFEYSTQKQDWARFYDLLNFAHTKPRWRKIGIEILSEAPQTSTPDQDAQPPVNPLTGTPNYIDVQRFYELFKQALPLDGTAMPAPLAPKSYGPAIEGIITEMEELETPYTSKAQTDMIAQKQAELRKEIAEMLPTQLRYMLRSSSVWPSIAMLMEQAKQCTKASDIITTMIPDIITQTARDHKHMHGDDESPENAIFALITAEEAWRAAAIPAIEALGAQEAKSMRACQFRAYMFERIANSHAWESERVRLLPGLLRYAAQRIQAQPALLEREDGQLYNNQSVPIYDQIMQASQERAVFDALRPQIPDVIDAQIKTHINHCGYAALNAVLFEFLEDINDPDDEIQQPKVITHNAVRTTIISALEGHVGTLFDELAQLKPNSQNNYDLVHNFIDIIRPHPTLFERIKPGLGAYLTKQAGLEENNAFIGYARNGTRCVFVRSLERLMPPDMHEALMPPIMAAQAELAQEVECWAPYVQSASYFYNNATTTAQKAALIKTITPHAVQAMVSCAKESYTAESEDMLKVFFDSDAPGQGKRADKIPAAHLVHEHADSFVEAISYMQEIEYAPAMYRALRLAQACPTRSPKIDEAVAPKLGHMMSNTARNESELYFAYLDAIKDDATFRPLCKESIEASLPSALELASTDMPAPDFKALCANTFAKDAELAAFGMHSIFPILNEIKRARRKNGGDWSDYQNAISALSQVPIWRQKIIDTMYHYVGSEEQGNISSALGLQPKANMPRGPKMS